MSSGKDQARSQGLGRRGFLLGAGSTVPSLTLAQALQTGPRMRPVQGQPAAGAGKPNIVFILMDNLGYGELGVYGGGITRGAPTPRIDGLASEGTRLLNFNVEAQCTPSRSAIMTGRFSIRVRGPESGPFGGGPDGLTQWEVTIAKLLASRGYATAHFGKWHLGSEDRQPAEIPANSSRDTGPIYPRK